jgi:hypothetical protein
MLPSDFRPLNPHGRPMPAPPRPIRSKPEPLFQVQVEDTRSGRAKLVGPRLVGQAAGMLCEAINREIAAGREKAWSNAHVVPVTILA